MRTVCVLGALCALTQSCLDRSLPPYGEALFIIDTDAPAPRLAGKLRLDVYAHGRWIESREIARSDVQDWPASFSVYNPSETTPTDVLVRVRVFPHGGVRAYHGEIFAPRPAGPPLEIAPVQGPTGATPRLLDTHALDITPATEPEPLVTIDRLVRVHLELGKRGTVRLVLRGNCFGTMADLASETTCVDTENVRVPVSFAPLDPDMTIPTSSVQGSWGREIACAGIARTPTTASDGTPLHDDEVCVPGGSFIFGNPDRFGDEALKALTPAIPPRVAIVSPFLMDRYEVTVGRWRDAESRGFKSPDIYPVKNEAPIDPTRETTSALTCSWGARSWNREELPITCVSWKAARAFCAFVGGDLPTEVQWEWAAQAVHRETKTRYPWGDQELDCAHAVYARSTVPVKTYGTDECVGPNGAGAGPQPVDTNAIPMDLHTDSNALGVLHLAGSSTEHARDLFAPFAANCWRRASLVDPNCVADEDSHHSCRGGGWAQNTNNLEVGTRQGCPLTLGDHGFRCVRER